ncbi:hypothetical protein [Pseudomonas sp. R4-83]|uniref:hypothetical protein n=1 Tax=unclassified Pseudomonas TaxID=196821 RepID=UPI003DA81822
MADGTQSSEQNPFGVLRHALEVAAIHDGLKANFGERLIPLLYAEETPDFDTCFAAFARVAHYLLDHCAASNDAIDAVSGAA